MIGRAVGVEIGPAGTKPKIAVLAAAWDLKMGRVCFSTGAAMKLTVIGHGRSSREAEIAGPVLSVSFAAFSQ